jgi:hypothetical protein
LVALQDRQVDEVFTQLAQGLLQDWHTPDELKKPKSQLAWQVVFTLTVGAMQLLQEVAAPSVQLKQG